MARKVNSNYVIPDDVRKRLNFSDEQLTEICEAFDLVDLDRNGRLTRHELELMMKSLRLYPKQEALTRFLQDVDKNGGVGDVSFDEFVQFLCDRELLSEPEEEIRSTFRLFDKDGDGFLTAKDLKQVMSNLGEMMTDAEIAEMIKEADQDRDGRINVDEFIRMMALPLK